jgi:hypothetical protein
MLSRSNRISFREDEEDVDRLLVSLPYPT